MESIPETDELLAELFHRSEIVADLNGPQVEAWVSGLFPAFGDEISPVAFVAYCLQQGGAQSALVCRAIGQLASGELALKAAAAAQDLAGVLPAAGAEIGASSLLGTWNVEAPFGRSVVFGFDVLDAESGEPAQEPRAAETNSEGRNLDDALGEDPLHDLRHSILVELDRDGRVEDIQLAAAPHDLLSEAAAADDRVAVTEIDVNEATDAVIGGWPAAGNNAADFGPGMAANEQFLRHRIHQLSGIELAQLSHDALEVDIRRGLDDDEFADANRAARSTLRAALGEIQAPIDVSGLHMAWAGVIRGDGGELSPRERNALLWLEWADWLGAGIGMIRAGETAEVSGSALVDHVNRCPEVSSAIDKSDRDYAEWAFEVALDLLADAGAIEDNALTAEGYAALGPALALVWG